MSSAIESRILSALKSMNVIKIDVNDQWIRVIRKTARIINVLAKLCRERKFVSKNPDAIQRFASLGQVNGFEKWKWINDGDKYVPTKQELELARRYLLLKSQCEIPKPFIKSHKKLNPALDEDGVLRANGRTAKIGYLPIIIPAKSPLGEVLLRFFHGIDHLGTDSTLAALSVEYWLVNGRRRASNFVDKCGKCQRLRKRSPLLEMAPLNDKCTRSPVFSVASYGGYCWSVYDKTRRA